jgi:hypothetical protein
MRAPPRRGSKSRLRRGRQGQRYPGLRLGEIESKNFVLSTPETRYPLPTIPSFTHSKDLALNSPAHRSLEEIALETEEDHQDWNQRQSRVREQCAPLNGVGPY